MTSGSFRAVLVIAAFSISIGCSGGASDPPDGGPADARPLTLDDFANAFERAVCAPAVRCGQFHDLENCEAVILFAEHRDLLTAIGVARRGTSHFDPSAAAACVNAVPTECVVTLHTDTNPKFTAANLFLSMSACRGVFTGMQALGEPCISAFECPVAAMCAPNCSADTCCPSVCGPLPVPACADGFCIHDEGENCQDDLLCRPPAVCADTCVVPPAEGEACDPTDMFPCRLLDDFCDTATMRCTKRRPTGAACTQDECLRRDACAPTPPSAARTCQPDPVLGDPCPVAGWCQLLTCTPDNVCAAAPAGLDCTTSVR